MTFNRDRSGSLSGHPKYSYAVFVAKEVLGSTRPIGLFVRDVTLLLQSKLCRLGASLQIRPSSGRLEQREDHVDSNRRPCI